jgi:hypothetical protein
LGSVTNRDFILRTWYDENDNQELDDAESRRSVYVRVMDKVEAGQLVFVPSNETVSLAITVEPAIDYTLAITRLLGTNGWAAFADGSRTQHIHGSASVAIRGEKMSHELKNMRLRAVTDVACGEVELFRRDFTVGKIELQVDDEWTGRKMVSLPPASGAPDVAVVGPGDYVTLRAIGTPAGLEKSFGWQVGTNQNVIHGSSIRLTSPATNQGCKISVSLTIDDPQCGCRSNST